MSDYTKAELYTLCLGLSALMKEPTCCDAHALAVSTLKGKVMLDLIGKFADGQEMDLIPELNHNLGQVLNDSSGIGVVSLVLGNIYVLNCPGHTYHMCKVVLHDLHAQTDSAKVSLDNFVWQATGFLSYFNVPIDCLQEIPA